MQRNWPLIVQLSLLTLLGAGSFVVSYTALRDYAQSIHAEPAWLWPVLLDATAVAFSYSAYRSACLKRRNALAQTLAACCMLLSVIFQVAHATSMGLALSRDAQSIIAITGHAVAPISLFALLEVLIRDALAEHQTLVRASQRASRAMQARASRKPSKISDSQLQATLARCNSKRDAALALGVAESTIHRRLKATSAD